MVNTKDRIKDVEKPGFHNNTLAMYPMRNSSRIISQQGMFTLQGKSGLSLDEEHNGDLIKEGILKRIDLSPKLRTDIENYLKLCGVSAYTLFPDLDGLAKHINSTGYFRAREVVEKKY
ncbi:hypothetical protein RCO48_04515 [Peribacillus frigoritolerans]|nr:hypothetical protein [Peribacillus frigoritolerans]